MGGVLSSQMAVANVMQQSKAHMATYMSKSAARGLVVKLMVSDAPQVISYLHLVTRVARQALQPRHAEMPVHGIVHLAHGLMRHTLPVRMKRG